MGWSETVKVGWWWGWEWGRGGRGVGVGSLCALSSHRSVENHFEVDRLSATENYNNTDCGYQYSL